MAVATPIGYGFRTGPFPETSGDVTFEGNDILMTDADYIYFGDASDVSVRWTGSVLEVLPVADDTGAINIGDGSTDIDFKHFLGATTAYVEFNVGAGQVNIEGAELHLGDNDAIEFGDATSGDVTLKWDGSNLEFLPATDDTGVLAIGDGTTDMDFKHFLGATTAYFECNVGDGQVNIEGAELHLGDSDEIEFGDGNDVLVQWNGSNFTVTPAADDTGAFIVGDGSTPLDIDFKVFLGASGSYFECNRGDGQINIEGAELHLGDSDEIEFGDGNDVVMQWDGSNLTLVPATDDTGAIIIGDGATPLDMDVKWFGGASTKYVEFNRGDAQVNFEDADLHLGDADVLEFGDATAGDVAIQWNGTNLTIVPAADDTGAILIGDGSTPLDMDLKWFAGAASKYVEFNRGDSQVNFEDTDLHLGDDDVVEFGDATAGDVAVSWNATYLQATAAASALYTAMPSKLQPNHLAVAYELYDDFFTFDDTATVGNWVATHDDTGDVAKVDEVAGGQITITCKATTDDDGNQIQYVTAPFKLAAGKHLWFEARVKMAEATQSDLQIGLVALGEDLTGVADNYAQDGVLFTKDDGGTTLKFTASKDGTDTGQNTDVGTLDTSFHVYGFYVNGLTNITPYFDGTADTAITATLCDDESLAPHFGVRNGDGVITNVMTIDYVRVVQLR